MSARQQPNYNPTTTMTTTTKPTLIKLRNKLTGKFFSDGKWDALFCEAGVFDKEADSSDLAVIRHTWDMTFVEEVVEIDDTEKPVKVSDYRGIKSYKYKGNRIMVERKTVWDRWTKTSKNVTNVLINGEYVVARGIRTAQKIIDRQG